MAFLYILLIMTLSIGLTYLGASIYRKYKDNQLFDGFIDDSQEDLIGDEWKIEEQANLSPSMGVHPARCGFQPDDKGYLPCKRIKDHAGPCAHDLKPAHEGNQVIGLGDAKKQFDIFKNAVVRDPLMCINHDSSGRRWNESCDCEVDAHNEAYDKLVVWLKDKETRTFGNQVADPLASIGGRKAKAEKMPATPKTTAKDNWWEAPPKTTEPLLPLELLTFCGNNKLQIENVIALAKQALAYNETEKSPYANTIRKNAVEKERVKWLEELKAIEEKVKAEKEDDAFHLKVVTDEKARLEGVIATMQKDMDGVIELMKMGTAKIKEQAAEIDALKENQKRADQYRYDVKATDSLAAYGDSANLEVTKHDGYTVDRTKAGYTVDRTKAGGPVTTQTGKRKSKKKSTKRKK